MFARALKSNVIISMAVLLFIGMVLIDFVAIRTFQQQAIQAQIDKCAQVVRMIEYDLAYRGGFSAFPLSPGLKTMLMPLFSENDISCARIQSLDTRTALLFGDQCERPHLLEKEVNRSINSGLRRVEYSGSVWGVYWWQRECVILSTPLVVAGQVVGGMSLVSNLKDVYQDLRNAQKYVFIYLIVNIIILTFSSDFTVFLKYFWNPLKDWPKERRITRRQMGLFSRFGNRTMRCRFCQSH